MFVPPATNLVQSQQSQPWGFKGKSLVMTRIMYTLRLFTDLCLLYFFVDFLKHNIFELQNEDLKTLEIIPVTYLPTSFCNYRFMRSSHVQAFKGSNWDLWAWNQALEISGKIVHVIRESIYEQKYDKSILTQFFLASVLQTAIFNTTCHSLSDYKRAKYLTRKKTRTEPNFQSIIVLAKPKSGAPDCNKPPRGGGYSPI